MLKVMVCRHFGCSFAILPHCSTFKEEIHRSQKARIPPKMAKSVQTLCFIDAKSDCVPAFWVSFSGICIGLDKSLVFASIFQGGLGAQNSILLLQRALHHFRVKETAPMLYFQRRGSKVPERPEYDQKRQKAYKHCVS